MKNSGQKTHSFLYEQVEQHVRGLIASGALKPGDRAPSLRHMSKQARVSVATVMQAYMALERKGYIESRPKSGFFVRQRAAEPTLPRSRATKGKVRNVRVSDTIGSILAAAHSPGIVSLGLANPSPELLPSKALTRALTQVTRHRRVESMRYSLPNGTEELRRQVAFRCADNGCQVAPDEIVVTTGATEALAIALRAVANPGDVVAVESPCYFQLLELIENLGMLAVQVRTDPAHGLDLEALERVLRRVDVKAMLCVPNFHNPLGSLMSDDNKRTLVSMLAERTIPLIEDDVYGDLHFDEPRPRLAKAFDEKGLVLCCTSVSKTVAPGYRVGWLLPGQFFGQAAVIKRGIVGTTATLPQLAIAEFLRSGNYDRYMRGVRKTYEEQVDHVRFAIAKFFPQQTRVSRPRGGFVLWVELPPGVDGDDLFSAAIEQGVSITPGSLFSPTRKFKNYIRVSAGLLWSDRVDNAIATVGAITSELADKR